MLIDENIVPAGIIQVIDARENNPEKFLKTIFLS
jgi:hypothetical protein